MHGPTESRVSVQTCTDVSFAEEAEVEAEEEAEAEEEVEEEDTAQAAGDPLAGLSKNGRKRLLKASQLESRKAKRKEEKNKRKQARREKAAALASEGATVQAPSAAAAHQEAVDAASEAPAEREDPWAMWKRFGCPKFVLAPMVNQSELAFRLLARRHGAHLTYTPMLHSTRFAAEEGYRLENFDYHPQDRPLVAQFCGDNPATLLAAARLAQDHCDAIDLNCGCPQGIARRGHYGAFLLDEPELIEDIVRTLVGGLRIPVFVKMRVLPQLERTLSLVKRLEAAGCSLLTIHGRTREQKTSCAADWALLATIKRSVTRMPVVANGGVEQPEDLERCLAATGCDAVMTSEAALENPSMLAGVPTSRSGQAAVTREYIALARAHPPRAVAVLKAHLFKLLFLALEANRDLRDRLGAVMSAEEVFQIGLETCEREEAAAREHPEEMNARCDIEGAPFTSWYRRHRNSPLQTAEQIAAQPPRPFSDRTLFGDDAY